VLLIPVAALEPWRLWLDRHHFPSTSSDYHVTDMLDPAYMAQRVDRISYSADAILAAVFRPGQWLIVLPLALVAIAFTALRVPKLAIACGAWLVLAFAGLIVVYWAGRFPSITFPNEVQFTAYRIAATVVIVAATVAPAIVALSLESAPGVTPAGSTARSGRARRGRGSS
jgi:hypothetical protein